MCEGKDWPSRVLVSSGHAKIPVSKSESNLIPKRCSKFMRDSSGLIFHRRLEAYSKNLVQCKYLKAMEKLNTNLPHNLCISFISIEKLPVSSE